MSFLLSSLLMVSLVGAEPTSKQTNVSAQEKEIDEIARLKSPQFEQRCLKLLTAGDFEKLDQCLALAHKVDPFDTPMQPKVYKFFSAVFLAIKDPVEQDKVFAAWEKKNPKSCSALLGRARILMRLGWLARRGQLMKLENPIFGEIWFKDFHAQASEKLTKCAKLSKTQFLEQGRYCELRLDLMRAMGVDKDLAIEILKHGAQEAPYQLQVYYSAAFSLMPRSYHAKPSDDGFKKDDWLIAANLAVEKTKGKFGQAYYARLLGQLAVRYGFAYMFEQGADWKRLQQGFVDLAKHEKEPSIPWNLYMMFAVAKKDQKKVRELLAARTDQIKANPALWNVRSLEEFELEMKEWSQWADPKNKLPKEIDIVANVDEFNIDALCFSNDGRYLFVAVRQGALLKIDLVDHRAPRKDFEVKGQPVNLVALPHTTALLVVSEERIKGLFSTKVVRHCRVLNYKTGKITCETQLALHGRMAVSDDGLLMVSNIQNGRGQIVVGRWNPKTSTYSFSQKTLKGFEKLAKPEGLVKAGVCLLPTNQKQSLRVAFASNTGGLLVYDLVGETCTLWHDSGQKITKAPIGDHLWSVCSRKLLLTTQMDVVTVWDVTTGKMVSSTANAHRMATRQAIFLKPLNMFATTGYVNNTIRLWDASKGQPRGLLKSSEPAFINSIAISPDGLKLFHASNQGQAATVTAYGLNDLSSGQVKPQSDGAK